MASIETALYTRLAAFAGLTSLVSTRIYPGVTAQPPTYPFVVYQRISGPRIQKITGPSGVAQARFQIDAWADTVLGARAVADQIRYALDGYRGTSDTIVVKGSTLLDDRDFVDDSVPPNVYYRASQDFLISHDESTS